MDCSICYETITKETGKAELSCSHSFHLKCLSQWFSKNENCPCCRHQANATEKMYLVSEEVLDDSSEDSSDDDTVDDGESEDDSDVNQHIERMAAKERARHHFRLKRWDMTVAELKAYAATRISALVRGHQSRMLFFEFKCLKQDEANYIEALNETTKNLQKTKAAQIFYTKAASMTRPQYLAFSAVKIQSIWRGKKQKHMYENEKIARSMNEKIGGTLHTKHSISLSEFIASALNTGAIVRSTLSTDGTWNRVVE